MTYTRQSSLTGRGTATGQQIQAWLESRAQAGASYVGLPVFPIPAGLGDAIHEETRVYGLNQDLVAAQIAHETASWQSEYARERNNPAGIGAINADPDQAHWYDTPREGVKVQVAHLMGYIAGDGPWNALSPRYAIVKDNGWHGTVQTPGQLEQKWAWSPEDRYNATPVNQRYGARLAALANDLLAFSGEDAPVGKVPKPTMTHKPSPNKDGYNSPRKIEVIVNHIGTSTAESNLGWLTNPASGASCNAYVRKDGRKYELVGINSSPWTNGVINKPDMSNPIIAAVVNAGINPNTRTYTIEHEGEPGDSLTAAQIKSNNEITAWVSSEAGIEINRTTIIGHYQIDSVNRPYCPSFSDAEWNQLIDGANALLSGSSLPKPHPSARFFPETKYYISQGFRDFWEQFNDDRVSIQVFGYPLSEELPFKTPDGKQGSQQYFERAIFEWHPGTGVLLRRLGAEALEAA